MSHQLNKQAKVDMCKGMILRRYEEETKRFEQDFKKLADDVYQEEYGKYDKVIEQLPDKWFVLCTQLHVKFAGYYPKWDRGELTSGLMRPYHRSHLEMTMSRKQAKWPFEISFKVDHKFTKRFLKLVKEELELYEQIEQSEKMVMTQLNSLRTAKRIKDHWPEAEEFLPEGEKVWLPAIPVKDLNSRLGLDIKPVEALN